MMFSEICKLGKPGLLMVAKAGDYAVYVNGERVRRGEELRYAVVNWREEWVESVCRGHMEALERVYLLAREEKAYRGLGLQG